MSFASGYRGAVQGSVQANYTDQPGIAVPGMLAFASDFNYCDSNFIAEANGIACGAGVMLVQNAASVYDYQSPNASALLPVAGKVLADFDGVLVFDENAQSDENGRPGYAKGRVGRILRSNRVGGRVYVGTRAACAITDKVWWVVAASGAYLPGEFHNADLGGGACVDLSTIATFVAPSVAGGLAMIEFI